MHDTGGTHRATAVVCPPPCPTHSPIPNIQFAPRPGSPFPCPPGRAQSGPAVTLRTAGAAPRHAPRLPIARRPPRSRRVLRSAARPPQPHSPSAARPGRPLAHSRGRQRRRLHCGSSRASERRQRPPPPAPFQPRTPARSARPAAFHPPRGGAALLTARHHLRRRPPRPWPVGPARSCAWRGSRAPPCAGRRRRRRRRWDGRARGSATSGFSRPAPTP